MADPMPASLIAEQQASYEAVHLTGRCKIERRALIKKVRNGPYQVVEGMEAVPCAIAASSQRNGMTNEVFFTSFAGQSGASDRKRRLVELAVWADVEEGDRITLAGEKNEVKEVVQPEQDETAPLSIMVNVERSKRAETSEP